MYKGYKKWSSSLDIHLLGPSSIPMTLGPGLLSTYHLHPKQARAESHGNGVRTKQQCVCKANFFYIFISPLSLSFSFLSLLFLSSPFSCLICSYQQVSRLPCSPLTGGEGMSTVSIVSPACVVRWVYVASRVGLRVVGIK